MNKLISIFFLLFITTSCNNSTEQTSPDANEPIKTGVSKLKQLDSPADTGSAEPYLFTDRNGQLYMSWIEKKKDRSELKFSMFRNENWSEPLVISSGNNWFVNWADYPMLAADGNNNLIAHFLEKSGKGTFSYDVRIVTSADQGKTWTASKILHDDGRKAEHGFVSMIPYGENYFVTWLDGRNTVMEGETGHHAGHQEGHHGQMTIRGAVMDVKGNKSSEWELDNRVCDCCQTSATFTTNGPVVVYRDRSEDEIRDISIVRFVDGKWTAPKPIFRDHWKINGCPVNGPRIDAKGNNLAVAWFTSPNKNAQVKVIFSSDGGASFGDPIRIDEEGIGRVDLVMLDDQSAMVTWMEGSMIKAVKVYSNGKKEEAIHIAASSEARSSGFPQLALAGNNLFFAWSDDKEKRIKVAFSPVKDL